MRFFIYSLFIVCLANSQNLDSNQFASVQRVLVDYCEGISTYAKTFDSQSRKRILKSFLSPQLKIYNDLALTYQEISISNYLREIDKKRLLSAISIQYEPVSAQTNIIIDKNRNEAQIVLSKTIRGGASTTAKTVDNLFFISLDDYKITGISDKIQGAKPIQPSSPNPKLKPELNDFVETIYVEGGTFTMGCTGEQNDCDEDEKPPQKVRVASFYIGKYEITQQQWRQVMHNSPSYFKNCGRCPVEQVSWNEVQEFLKRLKDMTGKSYRLPTEIEWEFAARGGNKSKNYKFAGGNSIHPVGWYFENSNYETHPVGSKTPNELGIYDMSGNVWEWCQTEHIYESDELRSRTENKEIYRIIRGGGWYINSKYHRLSYRNYDVPERRYMSLGFRVVLSNP